MGELKLVLLDLNNDKDVCFLVPLSENEQNHIIIMRTGD